MGLNKMKDKICPNCNNSIPWDGLGWRCEKCGFTIEPTGEEVYKAVMEMSCMDLPFFY